MFVPIILIRPPTIECPRCQTLLKRGKPRFGPAEIKCGNCDLVLETGLTPWADLSWVRKIFVALGEVIAPSRWGAFLYVLLLNFVLLLVLGMFCACVSFVFVEIVSSVLGDAGSAVGWGVVGIAVLGIAALPVVRLVLLIVESNAYSHTGVPPVWKAGIL